MADYVIDITETKADYEYPLSVKSRKTLQGATENVDWTCIQADPDVFSYVKFCKNVNDCADVIANPSSEFDGNILGWILHFAFRQGVSNGTYNIFLQQNESLKLLNIQVNLALTGIVCPEIGDITAGNVSAYFNNLSGCSILHLLSNGSEGYLYVSGGYYAKINGVVTSATDINYPANVEQIFTVCDCGLRFFRFAYFINNAANEGVQISGSQPNLTIEGVSYLRLCRFNNPDVNGRYEVKFATATTLYIVSSTIPTYTIVVQIPVAADTYVDLLNLFNTYPSHQIAVERGLNLNATFNVDAFGDAVTETQLIP